MWDTAIEFDNKKAQLPAACEKHKDLENFNKAE